MKRLRWLIAITSISTLALAAAGTFTAVAGASWGPSAGGTSTTTGTKIKLVKTSLGKVLANSKGFTIYVFTGDTKNHDNCVKKTGCKGIWPMVTTKAKPVAGPGVKQSMLGTITVKGQMQVTYAGHPLYVYSGDFSPGETTYVGAAEFGGHWDAINAAGQRVK